LKKTTLKVAHPDNIFAQVKKSVKQQGSMQVFEYSRAAQNRLLNVIDRNALNFGDVCIHTCRK